MKSSTTCPAAPDPCTCFQPCQTARPRAQRADTKALPGLNPCHRRLRRPIAEQSRALPRAVADFRRSRRRRRYLGQAHARARCQAGVPGSQPGCYLAGQLPRH